MKAIDFRFRPPTEAFKLSHRALDDMLGSRVAESWYNASIEDCVKEMEELDLAGVVLGRLAPPSLAVSNDHVKELADDYPERFIPVAGIDPTHRRACQDEIDRIAELGFKGVHFDHGFVNPPMLPNDSRLYPIYARCEDLDLILCLTIGPVAGKDISYSSPLPVEQVAIDFPKLRIVIAHGCWPLIDDVISVMWRQPNIWLSPDSYHYRPGGYRYVEYFNISSPLQDRYLYGSSYPFGVGTSIKDKLEAWNKLPWDETLKEKLLCGNATRLLGITK